MRLLIFAFLLAGSLPSVAQTTIDLTEDLVLTETLVLTENTVVNGNGFKIICATCKPLVYVKNGAFVQFEDVQFPRSNAGFIRADGNQDTRVTWNGPGMVGGIRIRPADRQTR